MGMALTVHQDLKMDFSQFRLIKESEAVNQIWMCVCDVSWFYDCSFYGVTLYLDWDFKQVYGEKSKKIPTRHELNQVVK